MLNSDLMHTTSFFYIFVNLGPILLFFRTFHLKLQPLDFNKNIFDDSHIIDVDGIYHSNMIRPSDFIYEGYLDGIFNFCDLI